MKRGGREHLLAVAGAEGFEDRLLGLAGRQALVDLLLHRLAGAALEVVAGVDGETASTLAGERLLDLLLRRGVRGRRRREEQGHRQESRRTHAQSVAARTRPRAYAGSRRSAGVGHIATVVPRAMTMPPIQIHDTSGFTYARIVTSPDCSS